jgi:hypothetical protein
MVLVAVQALAACGSPADALQPGEVTLQPDVVVVSGGADAIRSQSPDGLTWTIKGGAPGADRLVPGKVMFVTGLAVGRVLAVRSSNGDRVVTLGPASITDVIQDGDIASSQPVAIDTMTAHTAPQMPVATAGGSAGDTPAPDACSGAQCASSSARLMDSPSDVDEGDGLFLPTCCAGKIGFAYTRIANQDVRVDTDIWLTTASPRVTYNLSIRDGARSSGSLRITGITGLHFQVAAATPPGAPQNISETYLVPVEFTLPVTGIVRGVRLPTVNITLTETWVIETFFTAGDSVLKAAADYSYTGNTLAVTLAPGSGPRWTTTAPTGFTAKTKLLNTLGGYSIGVAGLAVSFNVRLCVCVGSWLSGDGLYITLGSEVGIVNDSSAVAALGGRCRGANFVTGLRYGLGHYLDPALAAQINSGLSDTGASPIEQSNGLTATKRLFGASQTIPNTINYTRCGGQ